MQDKLHLTKYLKGSCLLLVAMVLVVSPSAESNWLAGANAANSGNSLKQNLGKLTDTFAEMMSASMEGDGAKVEKLWGEVKKVPADIVKDNFSVLKVGDVAAGAWDSVGKRLNTAERKINRFVGRAGETITDARAALTSDNDEWDWYKSETPLPRPTVTKKTAVVSNNSTGWGSDSINSDWSDSRPLAEFRKQMKEEEQQAKLEGDRWWVEEQERRAQLAKEEECLGLCDEVESDESKSDYASALAETMGETPVAANNQNSYQVELENLEAERQAQLERERIEEERKRIARLEQEKKERQRQERQRQERLAEQELAARYDRIEAENRRLAIQSIVQSVTNLAQSAHDNTMEQINRLAEAERREQEALNQQARIASEQAAAQQRREQEYRQAEAERQAAEAERRAEAKRQEREEQQRVAARKAEEERKAYQLALCMKSWNVSLTGCVQNIGWIGGIFGYKLRNNCNVPIAVWYEVNLPLSSSLGKIPPGESRPTSWFTDEDRKRGIKYAACHDNPGVGLNYSNNTCKVHDWACTSGEFAPSVKN